MSAAADTEDAVALDHVNRRANPSPQLEMQRPLARAHLEHLPPAAHADAIEQLVRNRIP